MKDEIRISFEREVIQVALADILPMRKLAPNVAQSKKYERIAISVGEVGIIEPLVLARQKEKMPYFTREPDRDKRRSLHAPYLHGG